MAQPTVPDTIVVFTGNSNSGSATIEALYAKQQVAAGASGQVPFKIRAVVRKESKSLPEWAAWNIDVVVADVTRPTQMAAVFANASAAMWVPPTSPDRVALTETFFNACIAQGVDYPLTLSMIGVENGEGVHFDACRQIEEVAKSAAGTKVKEQFWTKGVLGDRKQILQPIILRVGQFYENMYGLLPALSQGKLYYPLGDQGRMPHVATADIGSVAADCLINPVEHAGATLNVVAEYVCGGDLARKMNMVQIHPAGITYERIPPEVAKAAFAAAGLAPWIIDANLEVLSYYANTSEEVTSDIRRVLGHAHRDFKDFCKELKEFIPQ